MKEKSGSSLPSVLSPHIQQILNSLPEPKNFNSFAGKGVVLDKDLVTTVLQREGLNSGYARSEDHNKRKLSRVTDEQRSMSEKALAMRVARKLRNPDANPLMSVAEASYVFGKSKATVYRWITEGKLVSSKVAGRIRTSSVLELLEAADHLDE